ncbi:uncharacterized protein LOC129609428 isoform X1 [Condylostylus longicornis]|uniref:uncharacterized protein LOC129609428 isoform X1 n=1 Tax=Condylostylus longicornis TaxID=2530218 RepID=UPI00244E237A|nr:uncharacterized protein LOC129609428 isoform X1 [Condylostylus longicornis]
MKSTFVIFILINLFLLTFTKSIAEEDDNAKYCKVKEHRNVKVKAGEHLVLPEKCQIIKCDEQGEKYTIEKSQCEGKLVSNLTETSPVFHVIPLARSIKVRQSKEKLRQPKEKAEIRLIKEKPVKSPKDLCA